MGQAARVRLSGWIRRPWIVALAAALVTLGIWFGPLYEQGQVNPSSWLHKGDTPSYRRDAALIDDGKLPYRDFHLEYPPLALPVFMAPYVFGQEQEQYRHAFVRFFGVLAAALAACAVFTAAALKRGPFDQLAAGGLVAVGPLLLGDSIALTRFDLWPTLLAAIGCLFLARARPAWAAAFAGLGTAAKLWPVLLLVPAASVAFRRAGWASVRRVLLASAIACGIPFAVGIAMSLHGTLQSFHYQTARPLEFESLGATVLLTLQKIGIGGHYPLVNSYGSFNLSGGRANAVAAALSAAGAVAVIAILVLGVRRVLRAPVEGAPTIAIHHAFAAVAAAVALGKVLSPQYMLWLLPFPLLLAGRARYAAAVLVLAAIALTRFDVLNFDDLLHYRDTVTFMVLARNVVLVALAGMLVLPVRRAARVAAPDPSPA